MQLAPLMPGKLQAPLHRQHTHALLGRPLNDQEKEEMAAKVKKLFAM